MDYTLGSLLGVLIRYAILGGLVFTSVTYIPRTPLGVSDRGIITALVVGVFALLNFLTVLFPPFKAWVCGCQPVAAVSTSSTTGCAASSGDLLDLKL